MIDPANWKKLAAPIPPDQVQWRQDGRPVARDGKYFARFVAYIDANTVRERLDHVVPGEWDLTLELLPVLPVESEEDQTCSFKARLQILGVIREDVGHGRDYKQAATDAFKRAAVRFGVAHELYAYEQNWVQVDGDGKYAKPVEDPTVAYERRHSRPQSSPQIATNSPNGSHSSPAPSTSTPPVSDAPSGPLASDEPSCPKCGGRMWDNRLSKRNPKAPDYKCRNRSCGGVIWPSKAGSAPTRGVDELPEDFNTLGSEEIPF